MSLQIDILLMQQRSMPSNLAWSLLRLRPTRETRTGSHVLGSTCCRRSNLFAFLYGCLGWFLAKYSEMSWANHDLMLTNDNKWCRSKKKKIIMLPFLFQILRTDFLATKPTQTTSSFYEKTDSPFWLGQEMSSTTLAFRIWRKMWTR